MSKPEYITQPSWHPKLLRYLIKTEYLKEIDVEGPTRFEKNSLSITHWFVISLRLMPLLTSRITSSVKTVTFLTLFNLSTLSGICQETISNPDSIQARILLVEDSLVHWGKTYFYKDKFNLKELMEKRNVPGVSIAVINNFQIEWAKGYGWAEAEKLELEINCWSRNETKKKIQWSFTGLNR